MTNRDHRQKLLSIDLQKISRQVLVDGNILQMRLF